MKKRLLSILLTFMMILTMFPSTGFAIDMNAPIESSYGLAEVGEDITQETEETQTVEKTELPKEEAEEVKEEASEEETSEEDTQEIEEETSEEDTQEIEEETSEEDTQEIEEETSEEDAQEIEEETSEEDTQEIEEETSEEDTQEIEEETSEEDAQEIEEETSEEDAQEIEEETLDQEIDIIDDMEMGIASDVIENGVYTIDVRGWHATNDTVSMMASALDQKAMLEIFNGEIYATIRFIPTSIFGVPITGTAVKEIWPGSTAAGLEAGTGQTGTIRVDESQTYRFSIDSLDMPLLSMYVGDPMNTIQTIRLNFDMETLEEGGLSFPDPASVAVEEISIKTAPTKVAYIEGDMIELSGLEVILIKEDSSTEEVAFEDFEAKGIVTSIQEGHILAIDDTQLVITHVESGAAVNQALQISAKPIMLADGSYTIDVRGWHATNNTQSMMASLLAPQAMLEVSEGKMYATIKFIKGNIMGVPVVGSAVSEVWAEQTTTPTTGTGIKGTVNEEEGSNTYRIEISTLNMPKLDMMVAMMGSPSLMTVRLNFDESSLEEIESEDNPDPSVAVEEISIKTAPTKIGYIEGDILDLSGLEVILIKEDGSTEEVAFADFEARGIVTSLQEGDILAINDIQLVITHVESGAAVNQALQISAKPIMLADGSYTIDVRGWHATNNTQSMMASLLAPQAMLEVSEGKMYATIKFIKGNIMGVPVVGSAVSEVWAEQTTTPTTGTGIKGTVNEEEGSNTYRIEISTLNMPKLDMMVAMMGSPSLMTIRLNFDESSLEEIESDDEVETPKEINPDKNPVKEIETATESIEVTKETVKDVDEFDNMAVKIVNATINIPVKIFKQYLNDETKHINIIKTVIREDYDASVRKLIAGNDTLIEAFDLSMQLVSSTGETENISELGEKIRVMIHLTDEQVSNISKTVKNTLYYYNPNTDQLEDMKAIFDVDNKRVIFYTDHLSTFVVVSTRDTTGGGEIVPIDELKDGYYTIEATALYENSNSVSMVNQFIKEPANLEVRGNRIIVTMAWHGTEYVPMNSLKELKYKNSSGNFVNVQRTLYDSSNMLMLTFEVENLDEPVVMQVSVPMAMVGYQPKFRLVFNLNTLKAGTVSYPISAGGEKYIIEATAGEGGTIDPDGKVEVEAGKDQTFTIKADEGYKIKEVIVDNESVGAIESYTFEKIEKSGEISVTFEKIEEGLEELILEEEEFLEISFKDIEGHWAESFIKKVVRKGIMTGIDEETFSPDSFVTREMFVTILAKLYDADVEGYDISLFEDVNPDEYYAKYIHWAADKGIVKGLGEGKFEPEYAITREQLAVMFVKYAAFAEIDLKEVKVTKKSLQEVEDNFVDEDEISPWARDSVKLMKQSGIMVGKSNNKFYPKASATRAEVATIIAKILDVLEEKVEDMEVMTEVNNEDDIETAEALKE
ncbi:Iron Transport-associated domain-containing protein [Anaerovirgula multivorans]|uniref:Iron Transport-associated domain-containing protein n=1 Tax=Anaerovirgula multivorans TaxID=312168 RepID=A0A239H7R0_9FIRM|nr:NEAT domain-containing protein [Anaerovirgula multivorans]SNS77078.1 Iron Transport-associated domain-containing protein [Anaerovirgula multivorans]